MPKAPIAPYDDSVTHQLGVLLARGEPHAGAVDALSSSPAPSSLVIVATAVMQVRLNAWNRPFYDAIERRDLEEFLHQLGVFFVIAGILLVLNVAQTGFNQLIRVKLRELATTDLIGNWMTRKRAARIGRAGEIGVNPDQRIQADAQTLTELTTDLGIGLLQSSVLLASFIGVLWVLSRGVVIPVGGRDLAIPGYMVWAALIYALSGSLVSWRVGRPLVRLGTERYAREADFRFALVQGSERAEGIALSNGEADDPARPGGAPRHAARGADRRIALRAGAPDLGDRRLRLGRARLPDRGGGARLLRRAPQLRRADDGRSAPSTRCSRRCAGSSTTPASIADWRATLLRVMNFRQALLELDAVEAGAGLIERREDAGGPLHARRGPRSRPGTAASPSTSRGSRSRPASACSSSASAARGAPASSWRSPGSGAPAPAASACPRAPRSPI